MASSLVNSMSKLSTAATSASNPPSIDELCHEVLLEHRQDLLRSADDNDVFLNHLIDHLLAKRCLQDVQRQLIKSERIPSNRCAALLDFVGSEGHRAFHALCDALDQFGTDSKSELATTMRKELRNKHVVIQWQYVKLIQSVNENNKTVCGLTTLNNELYVAYWDGAKKERDIVVYETSTYGRQRSLHLPQVGGVSDMTSCSRYQCIYISDGKNKVVHRVENENKITQWPVNDEPHGLSVNSAGNVLVTCGVAGKIKEFTNDGQLVREIKLKSDIVHPHHTVELTTDQFIVCHGDIKDPLHRVCIMNSEGNVIQLYGGERGSGSGQLNRPFSLAVMNGFILAADCFNQRVLMLSPTSSYIREVVSGLNYPVRLWFDEQTGRLYVANSKVENGVLVGGQVNVYSALLG